MREHIASEDARERADDPRIHVFLAGSKAWMAGTSPGHDVVAIQRNR